MGSSSLTVLLKSGIFEDIGYDVCLTISGTATYPRHTSRGARTMGVI